MLERIGRLLALNECNQGISRQQLRGLAERKLLNVFGTRKQYNFPVLLPRLRIWLNFLLNSH